MQPWVTIPPIPKILDKLRENKVSPISKCSFASNTLDTFDTSGTFDASIATHTPTSLPVKKSLKL